MFGTFEEKSTRCFWDCISIPPHLGLSYEKTATLTDTKPSEGFGQFERDVRSSVFFHPLLLGD